MKGNKNNCCEIKYKLTNNTITNYEVVTGLEITSIKYCDETLNDNPHYLKDNEIKDFNTITLEKSGNCFVISVGKGNKSGITHDEFVSKMVVDKLYKDSLGDAFIIKI